MTRDNPIPYTSGDRLYRHVKKVTDGLQPNDTVAIGIAKSVGATTESVEHFRTIVALRKLFQRVEDDLMDSTLTKDQKKRHVSDIRNVKAAFSIAGLNVKWAHAQSQQLAPERRERLFYTGSALLGALGANSILATELEELIDDFEHVLRAIDTADIPEYTHNILKRKIDQIIFDLKNSDLFGPEEIHDDVAQIIGEVAMATDIEMRKKNPNLFKLLGAGLRKTINVMNKSTKTARSIEYFSEKSEQLLEFLSI